MRRLAVLALLFSATAQSEEWRAGPLTIRVHISRTANLFHIVDQVSAWSRYTHQQYGRHFRKLSAADREQLARHRLIRERLPWGRGLEQTFYTPEPLRIALEAGVANGYLTVTQARIEREVLEHFRLRVDALLTLEQPRLEAFRERIHENLGSLGKFAGRVSRLCHDRRARVPVYLIANPTDHDIGGGFNGGRLTLEVPRKSDAYPTFLHELMHAFVNQERDRLVHAVASVDGLDVTTLNEGIAYALSPGIYFADGHALETRVKEDLAAKRDMTDPYVRFRRYGHALAPLMRKALADPDTKLKSLLPDAVEAWTRLVQVELERKRAAGPRPGIWFSAGPGWKPLGRRLRKDNASARHYSFRHSNFYYKEIFRRAWPGEPLVLLFALDNPDREMPPEYADVLPMPPDRIESELEQGRTIEKTGTARELKTILLAAPTQAELEELIRKTKLLER